MATWKNYRVMKSKYNFRYGNLASNLFHLSGSNKSDMEKSTGKQRGSCVLNLNFHFAQKSVSKIGIQYYTHAEFERKRRKETVLCDDTQKTNYINENQVWFIILY